MPQHTKKTKKATKKRKKSAWVQHVMAEYKRNKSAGFSAAMRRAKATWKKKKRP